jgi:dihydrofolate reductase
MRKIIYWMGVSLDGFIEGPDRDISWHRVDDELHRHFNEKVRGLDAINSGRETYEMMAEVWPTADQDPASTPSMVEFARIWLEMPKIVYSTKLEHAAWNTTIVRDIVPDEVRALKAEPGGDLVVGGPRIAAQFLRHDLIDVVQMYVNPVVIGAGTPMFPPGVALDFTFERSHVFGNGVVLLSYTRDASD